MAGQPVDVDQLRIVAQLGFSGSGGFGIDPTSYSPLRDPARSRDIDMVGRGGCLVRVSHDAAEHIVVDVGARLGRS